MNLKYLVSGYKGYLGQELIYELRKNLIPFIKFDYNQSIELGQIADCSEDIFVHLADPFSPKFSQARALGIEKEFTKILYEFGPRFIYVSSALVYCRGDRAPREIIDPVCNTDSYTDLKIRREKIVSQARGSILRVGNIYSARIHPQSIIRKIFNSFLHNNQISQETNPTRDYIHISDVLDLLLGLSTRGTLEEGIYNVGTEHGVAISEIYRKCAVHFEANMDTLDSRFPDSLDSKDFLVLKVDSKNTYSWWRPTKEFETQIDIVFSEMKETLAK